MTDLAWLLLGCAAPGVVVLVFDGGKVFRRRNVGRHLKVAARDGVLVRPHARPVSRGPFSRSDLQPLPEMVRDAPGSRPQATRWVGSPADLARRNLSPSLMGAGSPAQLMPQPVGRDRRGRVVRLSHSPASASTDGSVSNAAPGATPPALGAAFRVLPSHVRAGPATYTWPSLGPVPPSVGGRSSEAPQSENRQTPRPSPAKNQPRRPDNGGH